jgi:hypothetical protein
VYKISFDFPNLPKGGEIDITGLNKIFENGKAYVIEDDVAEQFRVLNPVVLEEGGYGPGATLLEAFKDNEYVKVETYTKPKAKEEGDK